VLGDVDVFLHLGQGVIPNIDAETNSVTEGQAGGLRGDESREQGESGEFGVGRRSDEGDFNEVDSFGRSNACQSSEIPSFPGQGDAELENFSLFLLCPLHNARQKRFYGFQIDCHNPGGMVASDGNVATPP